MKIVVIGGTGLIGRKLVSLLRERGHEVVPASPSSGVNALTGEGLGNALAGAQVVVDVANAPSFEDGPVMAFFETSGRNLLAAEAAAGVEHHVALSVVGTDRLQTSGYFRAKLVQEKLIEASNIPYTIVRATQFMEFLDAIAQGGSGGTDATVVQASSRDVQPIAADDVAAAMVDHALGAPVGGMVEIAGPERVGLAVLLTRYLGAKGDARTGVGDPHTPYFGVVLTDQSLTPGSNARVGAIDFATWMAAA